MMSTDCRVKVLLTEGSSSSARQTLYGLGSIHATDVLDPSPLCQCRFSRLVRHWYRCPSFSRQPESYLAFLARQVRRQGYDVLLPTHEQVYLLSRFADTLRKYVGLALPSFDALKQMQSKSDFARLMDRLNLPTPETVLVHGKAELDRVAFFPCYIKLAHSTAGYGVKRADSKPELRAFYESFERDGALTVDSEVVVQARAKGISSVVQAIFQHGRLIAHHCLEAHSVGLGGGQMIRVSVSHPEVVQHVRQLGEHLRWHGALFMDYFYDPMTGNPEYIEANPRIGETVNARLSGVNFCDLLVRISLGDQVEPARPTRTGVLSHNGFLILLAKAIEGAPRRDLIKQWWHMTKGRGPYRGCQNEMTRPGEDWGSLIPTLAVMCQLLANPRRADGIVRNTVENYALPETAIRRIDAMPADILGTIFK
jgi:predicted ATP-grasp superfamily ATP-dependent carboligase